MSEAIETCCVPAAPCQLCVVAREIKIRDACQAITDDILRKAGVRK